MGHASITRALSPHHDDLIFDVGMNICEDTDFYLRKGFRVVAIEANPASCQKAVERFHDEIRQGRLTVLNRAISTSREPLKFWICDTQSAWSTASDMMRERWAAQGATFKECYVKGITTGDLVREYGVPHFAKVDIEGWDLVCLDGFPSPADAPDFLSVEINFYKLKETFRSVRRLGYSRYAVVGQSTMENLKAPRPGREGDDVDYTFVRGCSGPFGRELTGPWLSADDAFAKTKKIIRHYRGAGVMAKVAKLPGGRRLAGRITKYFFPLSDDWYDLHAAR